MPMRQQLRLIGRTLGFLTLTFPPKIFAAFNDADDAADADDADDAEPSVVNVDRKWRRKIFRHK